MNPYDADFSEERKKPKKGCGPEESKNKSHKWVFLWTNEKKKEYENYNNI